MSVFDTYRCPQHQIRAIRAISHLVQSHLLPGSEDTPGEDGMHTEGNEYPYEQARFQKKMTWGASEITGGAAVVGLCGVYLYITLQE